MSRIVLIIPYVIYNLCISDKRIMELNFNFNRKDFIIFALIIIIHFFFNCSRLWNSYYIYINNNTYIVSILNYTNKILTIILLSLFMKYLTNFNFHIHHIISLMIAFLFTVIFGIIILPGVHFLDNNKYYLLV